MSEKKHLKFPYHGEKQSNWDAEKRQIQEPEPESLIINQTVQLLQCKHCLITIDVVKIRS